MAAACRKPGDHGRRRVGDRRRDRRASAAVNFFIDEEVLREEGVSDFSPYAPGGGDEPLQGDFFVPDAVFARTPTRIKAAY